MVASDTVVGLIGAGVLLVALVGVFVYESNVATATPPTLTVMLYNVTADGSALLRAQSGTMPPMGVACTAPACTPARTEVYLNLTGAPLARDVYYSAYLENPAATSNPIVKLGNLGPTGNKYAYSMPGTPQDRSSYTKLIVSLESTSDAATPTWRLMTFDVRGGPTRTSLALTTALNLIEGSGNHTLAFVAQGNQTNATATLEDLPQRAGFTYWGWLVKETDAGRQYTFVGKFSPSAPPNGTEPMDGTITGLADGAQTDYSRYVVTLEKATKVDPGAQPGGPTILEAAYNLPAASPSPVP